MRGKREEGRGKSVPTAGPVGTGRAAAVAAVLFFSSLFPLPSSLPAQSADQRIREQRDSLEQIRRERQDLERRASELRSTASDLTEEVSNLDRRASATARILRSLEVQLDAISGEVDSATANVDRAEAELAAKKDALQRHLAEIYKRGPLFTVEAMLSAHSFGELVARYKYLHTLTLRDRALVERVEVLRNQIALDRDRLVRLEEQLEMNRRDRQREEARLLELKRDQAAALRTVQQQQRQVEGRLAQQRKTEQQLASIIASFDAARRRGEAARPSSAAPAPRIASSIRTSDYGTLDWPVDGPLLYTFGKALTPTNTTIRWNGVGIQAPVGTPVRSVAAGKVVSVGQLGTYGLTVIIDHGGGDYSVYGSLSASQVKIEQTVTKGQVIGGAGISDPDLAAHLHFEIRHNGPAKDPAEWLKGRR